MLGPVSTDAASKWVNRIKSSGITELLARVRQLGEVALVTDDSEEADRQRLLAAVGVTEATISAADPEVVREASLTEISSGLNTMAANLAECQAQPNPACLGAAVQVVDPIMAALAMIYVPRTVDEAAKSVSTFKSSVAGSRSAVQRQLDDLASKVDSLEAALTSRLAVIQTEAESISASVNGTRAQIEAMLLSQQNAFDQAQSNRTSAYEEQMRAQRVAAEQGAAEAVASMREVLESETTRLATVVTTAEASNNRIDEILGLVGEKGLVGKYAEAAGKEKRLAFWWRVSAALVASAAIGVAIWGVKAHSTSGSWQALTPKLTLTLVIAGVAAYLGSVANDHRRAEKQVREVGLQLAAIKPYLKDLEDGDLRDSVLAIVATQLFTGSDSTRHGETVGSPGISGQLGDALADQIGNVLATRLKG